MFLGIYWLSRMTRPENQTIQQTKRYSLLAGIFTGLAVLTKGPVGLLLPALTGFVYWGFKKFKPIFYWSHVALFLLLTLLVSSAWYGLETLKNGFWFLKEFIVYQVHLLSQEGAGHGGPFYYHFLVLLVGCFPASILALGGLYDFSRMNATQRQFRQVMIILLTVVLGVFSIVETKIIHYSSLAYFPVTFLAAHFVYHWTHNKIIHWRAYQTLLLTLIGLGIGLAFTVLPFIGMNPDLIKPYIQGEFAKGNLQADINWTGWEAGIGLLYFIVIISAVVLIIQNHRHVKGFIVLFGGTTIVIQLAMYILVPKIEGYTQHAAIEFYKSKKDEDAYVEVLGFKSYAHLFYKKKRPANASPKIDDQKLLNKPIDKPAYFVVKNHDLSDYYPDENLKLLDRENGFVFLKRKGKKKNSE